MDAELPDDDREVVLLGEWCRRTGDDDRLGNAEVADFPWDDRDLLRGEAASIEGEYEALLEELVARLEAFHCVSWSDRAWRILLGPWVNQFLNVVHDRWASVREAMQRGDIGSFRAVPIDLGSVVPASMMGVDAITTTDAGNHFLYSTMLRDVAGLEPEKVGGSPMAVCDWTGGRPAAAGPTVSDRVLDAYSSLANRLVRNRDALVYDSFLRWRDVLAVTLMQGQVPHLWRSTSSVDCPDVDMDLRRDLLAGLGEVVDGASTCPDVGTCAEVLLPWMLPASYLEGLEPLLARSGKMGWPERPRVAWTANPHDDDVLKAYLAEKVESGTSLVVSAHSGQHGMLEWFWMRDHERAISDRYLTWGWGDKDDPKIRNIGYFRARKPLEVDHALQPNALMVLWTCRQPSLGIKAELLGRQWLDYFEDHHRFVECLPPRIRGSLVVRLHANDRGWDQRRRWSERMPDVELDSGTRPLEELVVTTRVYVSTYLGTNNLESLVMGIPSIMTWRPDHWELRPEARSAFDELQRVGVFHPDPVSAARHLADVWDDVDAWWSDSEVQDVVSRFCANYCPDQRGNVRRISRILRRAHWPDLGG